MKANRHGVWTLQVAFMKDKNARDFLNTYVISLSAKNECHEEVMKLLDDDMERFSNGDCPPLYHGCLKKIVLPVIVPILHHTDQPEKREVFGTKLGKGSNYCRWRYSLNFNEVGHLLPSCDVCKSIIMQRCEKGRHFNTSSLDSCQNCSN